MDDFQDNAVISFSADGAESLGTEQAPEKESRHSDQETEYPI